MLIPAQAARDSGLRYRRGLGSSVNSGGIAASGAGLATTAIIAHVAGGATAATGGALGAAAGPIGAAVGLVVGVIMTLWAAHEARAKGARTENAAVASAVQAFDGSLKAIFQAANNGSISATDAINGSISATDAINLCNQVLAQYWQSMASYSSGPGRADASGSGMNCAAIIAGKAPQCNKSCTAGCCVGCMDLYQSIQQCVAVFQAGGGTAQIYKVFGDHYGLSTREGYSLTYKPAAGSTGALASDLGLSGSTVLGIPTWLLALGGVGIYFAMR